MLDYLRNLTRSEEEKQRETLSAYVDDALSPAERERLERALARDEALRRDVAQMRLLRREMRAVPRRRVPRNFTLDPALYGRPRPEPLVQAYPLLRTATVLTAFFFIFALTANVFLARSRVETEMAAPVAMEAPAAETVDELVTGPASSGELLEEEAAAAEEVGEAADMLELEAPTEGASESLPLEQPPEESAADIQGVAPAEAPLESQQAVPEALATPFLSAEAERSVEGPARPEGDAGTTAMEAEVVPTTQPAREEAGTVAGSALPLWTALTLLLGAILAVLIIASLVARRRMGSV